MKFASTRGGDAVSLETALVRGIADDGGLFVPAALPKLGPGSFDGATSPTDIARVLLEPFFDGSSLAGDLDEIVAETLHFPLPLVAVGTGDAGIRLLELHHGPTAAFKDVGAGFLAACLSRLRNADDDPLLILVATSGDTGGAVAAAFDGRDGIRVAVLFPRGRVSARQARQLTCWGDNVLSLEVEGTFDDCQSLVKAAFANAGLARRYHFSSANSINIGRLLPQSTYYAYAALTRFRETGVPVGFIVPTGNLGNALACILARDMGLPIDDIVLATNANRLIADFLAGADWSPRASLQTLATAMDVGNPSNMERLRYLHGDREQLNRVVRSEWVSDRQIEAQIRRAHEEYGLAICPHTATAFEAWERLEETERRKPWVLVSTAHAAKFEAVVEPLIGTKVEVPPALAAILERPSRSTTIAATLEALEQALDDGFGGD